MKHVIYLLRSLSNEDLAKLAQMIGDGYRCCGRCEVVTNDLYEYEGVSHLCENCYILFVESKIASFALAGASFDRGVALSGKNITHKQDKGFTYLCRTKDGLVKIGATKNRPILRLRSIGLSYDDFLFSLESNVPFFIEDFLHKWFEKKNAHGRDYFSLNNNDVNLVRSMHTFDVHRVKLVNTA